MTETKISIDAHAFRRASQSRRGRLVVSPKARNTPSGPNGGPSLLAGSTAFSHWRSAGGAEVDLLLERDGILYPFECKLTANPSPRDASGLAAFRRAHPDQRIAKGAILCSVERPFWLTEDVAALPWNLV